MKACPVCGEQIDDAATSCPYCQHSLTSEHVTIERRLFPRWLWMALTLVVVLGVAAIVVIRLGNIYLGPFLPARHSVSWTGQAAVYVHRSLEGLRVSNDSADGWRNCEVEIEGGYHAALGEIGPHQSKDVGFDDFSRGDQKLVKDGFGRALGALTIQCDDGAGHRQGVPWGIR
jgi:hypothetical protein